MSGVWIQIFAATQGNLLLAMPSSFGDTLTWKIYVLGWEYMLSGKAHALHELGPVFN